MIRIEVTNIPPEQVEESKVEVETKEVAPKPAKPEDKIKKQPPKKFKASRTSHLISRRFH